MQFSALDCTEQGLLKLFGPRRGGAELGPGDQTPVLALSPKMGRVGGQAHLEQLALSGSLSLWDGEENVEMREPLPFPRPLAEWAGSAGGVSGWQSSNGSMPDA